MNADTNPDTFRDLVERLHEIIDEMLAPFGRHSPRGHGFEPNPPFDISKANMHDSKREFVREKEAVEFSATQLRAVAERLVDRDHPPDTKSLLASLQTVVDQKLRASAPRAKSKDSMSLIHRNIADLGGFVPSIFVLLELTKALEAHAKELGDQEAQFWSLPHRAPDHYARAIALRIAKLYALQTGSRPTVGSSGETGEPSTNYTRAVKASFDALDIQTGVRLPCEWAIEQLTDNDLIPPKDTLADLLDLPSPRSNRDAVIDNLVESMQVRPKS
ncbi:hypothetical protein [Psychromarinibacter halotolerans]|uniref:Uncharacterized protein n=1 Tax=Psychromarinibacter halotolerans TaxID=1775175 RepID=A0ABV7GS02_9RHOB|nr:hypothetical protein [Psychromarinibacter halotolerans]MDF0596750.1 hypothetical protein [Psychromarinibacter halotolerans]